MTDMGFNDCQYLSTTNSPPVLPPPSKPTKVNSTTISNPNRLSVTLMSVDEGVGAGQRVME